jgi:hypothetical protein
MAKYKYIALMKFKEGTSEEQIAQLFDELLNITEEIPGIEDYVSGAHSNPENLNHGYTHGLILTFSDQVARDGFLQHPEHERIKALINPHIESMLIFDFEVN